MTTEETVKLSVAVTVAVPLCPGDSWLGASNPPTTGGVRSRLTVTVVVAVRPALSVTVPVTGWLAPSVLTTTGALQVLIGEEPATQVNVTVALELFQPLALGVGEMDAVMVGPAAA